MREMKRNRFRKLTAGLSAVCLSAILGASMTVPVLAEDVASSSANAGQNIVKFVLEDVNGKETGDPVPYNVDEKGQPRSTYYDQDTEKDYDLVSSEGSTYTYKEHQDASYDVSVTCVANDNGKETILKTDKATISADNPTAKITVDKDLQVGGKEYTTTSARDITFDYNKIDLDNLNPRITYTLKSDDSSDYYVTVNYVTEDGNQIGTRSFHVKDKDHTFIAPKYFSVESDGTITYYKAVSNTTIDHKVKDTTRTYSVTYTETQKSPYSWYILLYDSETNQCIDERTQEVKPGETAYFDLESEITVNNQKYTLNKKYKDNTKISHKFGDADRTAYVYYDREGYKAETKTKEIRINYIDIETRNTIKTETVTVSSDDTADTTKTFEDSFDAGDVHYIRVNGQVGSADLSYFSPKTTYSVYYRDSSKPELEALTITVVEPQEVEVRSGDTTYTVLPGITRYIATDTSTGVSNVIGTFDANGALIATNVDANGNGTADGGNGADGNVSSDSAVTGNGTGGQNDERQVTIDGVQADDIQTPQGNIHLNEKTTGTPVMAIVIGCILAAAVVALIWLLLARARKNRADGQ